MFLCHIAVFPFFFSPLPLLDEDFFFLIVTVVPLPASLLKCRSRTEAKEPTVENQNFPEPTCTKV